ncbi:hypothetical protein OOZ15_03970 [Galbibacter sp. EGI 63066]|uniref:hypothetical protein n=1 Tax=Galbibacter sp. EGI 63066 TaxID=2993559 RepID=UPI00224937C4|nr:hypothetical protein [Galbibacter sp. EGI 63066]MCX2679088.1 hypothetical protein [Galbibacter sp. EGI 63066]
MQFRVLHWTSYVPLVEVSKTQHMWSFFGRSYNYNLFIGLAEFLIGVLIVFKRTRLIALLLSLGVCANILILNIEFDIYFAITHIAVDLVITILLLAEYRQELFRFFVKQGGRFNDSIQVGKSKFVKLFPYAFVIVLSISYFIFAFNLRSIVNEEVVGAYVLKSIRINDSVLSPEKGKIGEEPMLFLEYNNQIVLSITDSVYYGRYTLSGDSIDIKMYQTTNFQLKSLTGLIKNNNSIVGKTDNQRNLQLFYERVGAQKDYLNELYR